jgi:hypothetical protein
MAVLIEPIIRANFQRGNERPICETRGCHNFAIGYEKVGGWELRLCPEHASTELLKMKPGEEFDNGKDFRYRYQKR